MARADFRFHAELNHFLPASKREISFSHYFEERASIKDMIEALGIPHPEVDAIAVNGKAVDFSYIVQDGDRIEVYPVSVSSEVSEQASVRPQLLSILRFVLGCPFGQVSRLPADVRLRYVVPQRLRR